MPGIQQLAQLQSSAGGGSNGKALSWNDHVYLSNGGRFLHIFSLEKKNVTAVYLFPANIWHMELDTSTQQLYVLCANYGICLLEWDESGRLVKEPSSTSQNGTTTVYNIGESFDFLLDSSVHSFTLAFDVLVLVTLQPGKWQLKLLHRQSLQSEEVDEVNTSCMENPPVLPILCCASVQNENQRNCIPSSFVLETHLFTQLFGVDSSLLHSPIILCGFPDGQVVFFRLNSASSCEGWAPSGVKFFHHLEQPPVSIGAAKMRWRDESNELTIRSLDESPCDCLLLVGQNGSLVVMTPGEDTEGAMCNEHLEAPVCCAAYLSSGVYYATASDLFCLTVLRQVKDEDSLVEGGVVVTSVRHNIPMVAAVAQSDTSSDESTELVLLSSRGRLMLCTLEQKGIGDHHLGPETGDTGQRIKELLSGIGSVSDSAHSHGGSRKRRTPSRFSPRTKAAAAQDLGLYRSRTPSPLSFQTRPARVETVKKSTGHKKSKLFSEAENLALAHAMQERYPKLLGRLSAQTPPARKRQLWMEVVEAVNAVSSHNRALHRVKKRYGDLKVAVRKKLIGQRAYRNANGSEATLPRRLILTVPEAIIVKMERPKALQGVAEIIDTLRHSSASESPAQSPTQDEDAHSYDPEAKVTLDLQLLEEDQPVDPQQPLPQTSSWRPGTASWVRPLQLPGATSWQKTFAPRRRGLMGQDHSQKSQTYNEQRLFRRMLHRQLTLLHEDQQLQLAAMAEANALQQQHNAIMQEYTHQITRLVEHVVANPPRAQSPNI